MSLILPILYGKSSSMPTSTAVCALRDIPATAEWTAERSAQDRTGTCTVAIQANNAEGHPRSLVYLVNRTNKGLHLARLTGDAAKTAGEG